METNRRRVLSGTVVSDAANKTVIVEVTRTLRHPKYNKVIKRRKKFAAHDEMNKFKKGDVVEIQEHRPFSKTKTWIVLDKQ